ncbi:hypothetical protein SAMN05216243_2574 [Sediminibacillus albus]|uniref:Uncharacterized protein n=1 Tax=Sediminibacillus albus TaxID=407036 RepID=A0A1G9AKF4_9BACI|nr:hypothetical protein SAMN05216243_2574 [Sediminibacillus albus]
MLDRQLSMNVSHAVADMGQIHGRDNLVLRITTKSYRESLPSHTRYYSKQSYSLAYHANGVTKYLYF